MKTVKIILLIVLLLFCLGGVAAAEELVVSGQDFSFKVSGPAGWAGITADANRYRVNVYFPMPGHTFNSSPSLMYVRVMNKYGMTVAQHLQADMQNFAKKNVTFEDFAVPGLRYGQAAKKYVFSADQADYLCYVDPGEKAGYYVIFVLTASKELAEKDRDAFAALVQSFEWL